MAIKRPRYFDHQFLVEADFTLEQTYHLDMRRRLNKSLYSPGIAEGLEVTKAAAGAVSVARGVAIDSSGHEIVLEEQRVVPVPVTATAGARVFITAEYKEAPSDESTAPGAPKENTRFTETPIIAASTTAPASDGTVIPLADFEMAAGPSVPGAVGAPLGGVRQAVNVKGAGQGIVSLHGVRSPGGNIALLASNAIVISPDNANDRITIGESHSGRIGNPHQTTADQIPGAMLAGDYDLRRRSLAGIAYSEANANGAPLSVVVGFQPRVVIFIGIVSSKLTIGITHSGGISGFAFVENGVLVPRCFGFGITRNSATDWLSRSAIGSNICFASIVDSTGDPKRGENLAVDITTLTGTGFNVALARNLVTGFSPLLNFNIALQLLCIG